MNMKKRVLGLFLAVCLTVTALVVPAAAAETVRFSDIHDQSTVTAVESLRLLGVLDGYADGTFRPDAVLTRAQFCKMAVYAMNGESELGLYRAVTVFPDVKPSYWAAPYINMASKGKAIIAGYADGKFHPDRTVTVGQAVTILLRLLGYKDENVGGIWPQGYMAVGQTIGLTNGVSTDPYAGLTRGQAARLFLNLLRSDLREGGKYVTTIGTTVENQVLVSSSATGPDGRDNALQTASGEIYQLDSGKTSSGVLNGCKGTLVLAKNGNKVLTFVPDAMGASRTVTLASKTATQLVDASGVRYTLESSTPTYYNGEETTWGNAFSWLNAGTSLTLYLNASGGVEYVFVGGGSNSTAAVVVYEDGSAAGFDSLTGGVTNYSIYKNGASATMADLRKYDVAVYSSASNSIRVCDTRVTVYYEGCYPNAKEPSEITVLGGVKLTVLPTAMSSLAKFAPGDQMTLLLTEDGKVAGAVEAAGSSGRGNAMGIVRDGTVQMLCGTAKIAVTADDAKNYNGQVVRISSTRSGVSVSPATGGASGDLNVSARKLGGKSLTENVMIFRNGQDVSLSQLTSNTIPASDILYARLNWAGQVDLIVLGNAESSKIYYGRAVVRSTVDAEGKRTTTLEVVYGDGKSVGPFTTGYDIRNGDYVKVILSTSGTAYMHCEKLTELADVPNSAWSGETAVTVNGRTYRVSEDVPCFNRSTGTWMSLSAAHGYATKSTLYVFDGVVRAIEVSN